PDPRRGLPRGRRLRPDHRRVRRLRPVPAAVRDLRDRARARDAVPLPDPPHLGVAVRAPAPGAVLVRCRAARAEAARDGGRPPAVAGHPRAPRAAAEARAGGAMNVATKASITVLVPARGAAAFLPTALGSMRMQAFADWQA